MLQKYETLIKEKMDDYEKNVESFKILHLYNADASAVINNRYSDGSIIKTNNFRRKIRRIGVLIRGAFNNIFQ